MLKFEEKLNLYPLAIDLQNLTKNFLPRFPTQSRTVNSAFSGRKKKKKKELIWKINEVQFCTMFLERKNWIRNDRY